MLSVKFGVVIDDAGVLFRDGDWLRARPRPPADDVDDNDGGDGHLSIV